MAVIFTSSIIGVYHWQRQSTEELHIEKTADMLSETINRALTTPGDFYLNISYEDEGDPYIVMDDNINGEPFTINITDHAFTLHCGSRVADRRFLDQVRLLDPYLLDDNRSSFPPSEEPNHFSFPSGEPFVIESATIGTVRNVYIYPDDGGESRASAIALHDEIKEFINWNGSIDHLEYRSNISLDFPVTFLRGHAYPAYDLRVPIGTPVLNLSSPQHGEMDRMDVPADTSLHLNRTMVEDSDHVSIRYYVEKLPSSG